MEHYEHSLHAMVRLLEAVGEKHWAAWIREDIHLWEGSSETAHHLSAYGGMGSFNDVWICHANGHNVTEPQEAWIHTLFEWLKSVCYYLARHPNCKVTEASLSKAVGRHDSALAAFIGGDKASASMRGYASETPKLQGWRCLLCGYSEVSARDLEYLIARSEVPTMVFRACATLTLDDLVDRILRLDIPGITKTRRELNQAVTASGISLSKRDGWMRPCPNCQKDETAIYRWELARSEQMCFEPSNDNLPLRK